METRYTKYRTYKKIDICYDNKFKVWICRQMDFTAYTEQEMKNSINAEHHLNKEAGQCRWIDG